MKEKKVEQKQKGRSKGITLVALVVTIVVLLILAGVTITMLVGDNGIIARAREAKNAVEKAQGNEQNELGNLANQLANVLGENTTEEPPSPPPTPTPIDTTKSYVGYYADLNGDGQITAEADGIIYADLAVGGSGTWNSNDRSGYSYDAVTSGLKEYCINGTYTDTYFGERQIIKKVDGTEGNDRFYVMSLNNFTISDNTSSNNTEFCWYYSAYSDAKLTNTNAYVASSTNDFGKGKANTEEMVTAWNNTIYGSQNGSGTYSDMWGVIQAKVNEGWFVPSKSEWSAFGDAFKITSSNYRNFGLSYSIYSSTVGSNTSAYCARFGFGYVIGNDVNNQISVRLSATF